MTNYRTSDRGIEFIIREEAMRGKPYLDVADNWTVGVGHLMADNEMWMIDTGITDAQARAILRMDLNRFEKALNRYDLELNTDQVDAVISFMFNLGARAFNKSTLKKKIMECASDKEIEKQWLKWNKARVAGVLKPVKGLTYRRQREVNLFLSRTA